MSFFPFSWFASLDAGEALQLALLGAIVLVFVVHRALEPWRLRRKLERIQSATRLLAVRSIVPVPPGESIVSTELQYDFFGRDLMIANGEGFAIREMWIDDSERGIVKIVLAYGQKGAPATIFAPDVTRLSENEPMLILKGQRLVISLRNETEEPLDFHAVVPGRIVGKHEVEKLSREFGLGAGEEVT